MGKKKIRINFFSRLQSKKSTPPSLDGGILIIGGGSFAIGAFLGWKWKANKSNDENYDYAYDTFGEYEYDKDGYIIFK